MRTTLTQAWEARGLAGIVLRQKVAVALMDKCHKEDPERWKRLTSAENAAAMGVFGLFLAWLYGSWMASSFPWASIDLSRTLGFAAAAVAVVALVGLFAVFGWLTLAGLAGMYKAGLIDRYIFQHRDDEVEL